MERLDQSSLHSLTEHQRQTLYHKLSLRFYPNSKVGSFRSRRGHHYRKTLAKFSASSDRAPETNISKPGIEPGGRRVPYQRASKSDINLPIRNLFSVIFKLNVSLCGVCVCVGGTVCLCVCEEPWWA